MSKVTQKAVKKEQRRIFNLARPLRAAACQRQPLKPPHKVGPPCTYLSHTLCLLKRLRKQFWRLRPVVQRVAPQAVWDVAPLALYCPSPS